MNTCALSVLVGLLCLAFTLSSRAESTDACRARGQAALAAWTQGNEADAIKNFAPDTAAQVTPEKLKAAWASLQGVAGALQKLGQLQSRAVGGHPMLVARMDFAKLSFATLVDCDAQDRITTFRIVPMSVLGDTSPLTSAGVEHAVQVASPFGPLPGTLVVPEGRGPFPAVLLVVGSGALDRDETIGPNKPFRDLAEGLAAAGIASLRYDKRSHVYGEQMSGKNITVDESVTDDAVAGLQLLAKQASIDPARLFVLGHSLGAAMAPRIAQRDPQVNGIVLLAAPAKLTLDTVIRQMRYLGPLQGASPEQMDKLLAPVIQARDAVAHADPSHPPQGQVLNGPLSFWLSLRDYDPIATAKGLSKPILVLQGGDDYQVLPQQDFSQWQDAFAHDSRAKLIQYPGLSHLFMPGGTPPSPADYMKPGQVDAQVIRDIVNWIEAQPRHS
ncbi:alpha/beta hydrolase family protein [Dyella mobilis]|uniref:Alpha/beta fold hydrolase n=1 Tax=Dyella mobilis TaxID=1849582 RepID=A0ABS2KLD7_9GAMM|nr:alpha/beta fold hydrolase [Dyella mobilis]MBM7131966.1 alpha/beta fold hydrolase [Dyella mobilis]GLQ96052.1 hypothetical protein GCM10007863_04700 [Dyella mobilis]